MEPLIVSEQNKIELKWEGPFQWPGLSFASSLTSLDKADVAISCGIYLWTVEYVDGYLIYAAGITRRPFVKRFREHTRAYQSGIYTLFDIAALKQGVRQEIWHGFWFKQRSVEKQNEYNYRCSEIRLAADEQLMNFRIFVASVTPMPRILERLEAAVMNVLYAADGPIAAIPDRGMMLAPRWRREAPIVVLNIVPVLLYGLPELLII